jgi:PRTRC genetic system protein C
MKEAKQETPLADPETTWPPKRVLNFYATLYPILTTAIIVGPLIKDDKQYFEFQGNIGTKG